MKRLHIGGQSVLTGDELADAVIDYAMALYEAGHVEVIGLPIVDAGGEAQTARMLFTPALAVWTSTVARGSDGDPTDPALVRFLRERSRRLERSLVDDGLTTGRESFDPHEG